MGRATSMSIVHLETKVTLADQTSSTLIDIFNENWIKLNAHFLSCITLIVQYFNRFKNSLVVINMYNWLDIVTNVEFLF